MRLVGFLIVLVLGLFVFISCQRELSLENAYTGISNGTLKTVSGDCLPSGQDGVFKKGAPSDSSGYIYVDINVFATGSYKLTSDSVNGMHFYAEGVFDSTGEQLVRLKAYGTPVANGTVPYHITYRDQTCAIIVFVTDISVAGSEYYFMGANGACGGAVLSGNYTSGVAMGTANKVMIQITVTTTGTYSISTTTANGVTFSGTGNFTNTGVQEVALTATGVPTAAGDYSFNLSGDINACSFQVTFSN